MILGVWITECVTSRKVTDLLASKLVCPKRFQHTDEKLRHDYGHGSGSSKE
jgi:hypothetical protein